MNEENFLVTLFMWVAGVCFIIIPFVLLFIDITSLVETHNIKTNGLETIATISSKELSNDHTVIEYSIDYTVDDKEYFHRFDAKTNVYNKDDTIAIHYLPSDPNKVYVPIEKNDYIFAVFFGFGFFLTIGILCVRHYNIFKYKREIKVT